MDTPIERLTKVMTHARLASLSALARYIGVKPQHLYDIRDGRITSITLSLAMRIKKQIPDLELNWLQTGEGYDVKPVDTQYKQTSLQDRINDFILNEIASLKAAAKGTLAGDELTALKDEMTRI